MIFSHTQRRKQAVFYSTLKYGCYFYLPCKRKYTDTQTRTYILFCDKTRGTDVLFPKRNLIKHLFTLGYCCKNETATCSFITAVRIVIIDVYSDFCANKNINMPNFR